MNSPLLDKSLDFAAQIVLFYEEFSKSKKDTTIAKQLLRSATSVGGNINEAVYGNSKADFISKLRKQMKILFTAFKGVHNTSFQLVNQTAANYILLTNSFQGLEKDISFVSGDCSMVYMFGVDKKLIDKVRIEKSAKYNAETVCTEFDIHYLETMLESGGVSYTISDKPTRYLCNAAYYHMLKKNPNTVFIHIPSLKGMSVELMNKLIKIFNDICSD